MERKNKHSESWHDSVRNNGLERSPILELMEEKGLPMTREVYLGLAFMDSTYEPEAEEEAVIPAQFRKW